MADTAVPAWHDGHREMPLVFGASAASAAAGLGLLAAPGADAGPVRRLGVAAAGTELPWPAACSPGCIRPSPLRTTAGGAAG